MEHFINQTTNSRRVSRQLHGYNEVTPSQSIRDSARNPSVSTGRYTNNRMYQLGYRHNLNTSGLNDRLLLAENDTSRICYCDDFPQPSCCKECLSSNNASCDKHRIIPCSSEQCTRTFHVGCIASYQYVNIDELDVNGFLCIICAEMNVPLPTNWSRTAPTLDTKSKRLAIDQREDASSITQNRNLNKVLKVLDACKVSCFRKFIELLSLIIH